MGNYSNHLAYSFLAKFCVPTLNILKISLFILLCFSFCFVGQIGASQKSFSSINYHALIISITDYSHGWPDLQPRVGQVGRLVDVLQKQNYRIERLINPNYVGLKDGIEDFLDRHSKKSDRILIFYTGHCFQDQEARSCLIPSDASLPGRSTAPSFDRFLPIVPVLVSIEQHNLREAVVAIDGSVSVNNRQILKEYERNNYVFLRDKGYLPYTIIAAGTAGEAENAHSDFIDALSRAYEQYNSHKNILLKPFLDFVLQKGKFNTWQMPWFQTGGNVSSLEGQLLLDKKNASILKDDENSILRIKVSKSSTNLAIDGVTTTDFTNGVELPAGDYKIKYSSGTTTNEKTLTLAPGETVELFIYTGEPVNESSLGKIAYAPEDNKEELAIKNHMFESSLGIHWVRIPSGEFKMGSSRYMEGPIHTEYINNDFYIMDSEVSVKQYLHYLKDIGELLSYSYLDSTGDEQLPVTFVSWHDAVDFAQWVSEKTGRKCRLPSEAEWEYVAQMGISSRNNPAVFPSKFKKTAVPVQLAWRNSLNIAGMPGNVWEWCFDCWRDKYDKKLAQPHPSCSNRVIRGGSWRNRNSRISATSRNGVASTTKDAIIGFRLVMEQ